MTKVLVTGSSGFVGRNLIDKLRGSSMEIVEFTGRVDEDDAFVDYENLGIDHVLHLAAKTIVPDSWQRPQEFYRANVLGTLGVLGFCEKTGSTLTFISSYLYGTPESLPITESAPTDPTNPYALTKLAAEDACRFYAKFKNIGVCILRPFNIYGDGQSEDFLIPNVISQINSSEIDEIVLKDLEPRRDYIHIEDLVDLIVATANRRPAPGSCEVYNAGSGDSYSVTEIVGLIKNIIGSTKGVRSLGQRRDGEIMDTRADCHKANEAFDWTPKIDIEEGLGLIISSMEPRQQTSNTAQPR